MTQRLWSIGVTALIAAGMSPFTLAQDVPRTFIGQAVNRAGVTAIDSYRAGDAFGDGRATVFAVVIADATNTTVRLRGLRIDVDTSLGSHSSFLDHTEAVDLLKALTLFDNTLPGWLAQPPIPQTIGGTLVPAAERSLHFSAKDDFDVTVTQGGKSPPVVIVGSGILSRATAQFGVTQLPRFKDAVSNAIAILATR